MKGFGLGLAGESRTLEEHRHYSIRRHRPKRPHLDINKNRPHRSGGRVIRRGSHDNGHFHRSITASASVCKIKQKSLISFYPSSSCDSYRWSGSGAAKGLFDARAYSAFCDDQSAATATEFGLIAAGIISLAIIAIAFSFGSDRNDTYAIVLQQKW